MPHRPPHPCNSPGCPAITRDRYCPVHAAQYAERQRQRLAARPSAAARGYGSAWRKHRDAWLARHPLCAMCGQHATDVDHRIPLSDGGPDNESNYQSLCLRCHRSKTRRESNARQAVRV